jgi:hypothetical protein
MWSGVWYERLFDAMAGESRDAEVVELLRDAVESELLFRVWGRRGLQEGLELGDECGERFGRGGGGGHGGGGSWCGCALGRWNASVGAGGVLHCAVTPELIIASGGGAM